MLLLQRRNPRLEDHLQAFADMGERTLAQIEVALETYLVAGQGQAFEHSVQRTHEAERATETLHRSLRSALEALPGPPAQVELLAAVDAAVGMFGAAQSLLYTLRCQRAVLPPGLAEDFAQLLDLNLESCRLVMRRFRARLAHPDLQRLCAPDLRALEAQSAQLSRTIIFGIFDSAGAFEAPGSAELVLRDLVLMTVLLSERARRLAERLDQIRSR